jgi:hypothetical protein
MKDGQADGRREVDAAFADVDTDAQIFNGAYSFSCDLPHSRCDWPGWVTIAAHPQR